MAAPALDSASPRAYFSRALTAFDLAAQHLERHTRHVLVGGRLLELRFAGDALLSAMYPALSHLEPGDLSEVAAPQGGGDRPPDLVVHLWDSVSTGVAMPPPYWPLDSYAERGEIRAFEGSGLRAAFSVDGPTLELWDETAGHGIFWTRDARRLPAHERAAPVRRVLCWWLASQGLHVVHAGAVGGAHGCVLLAGSGGAGKSNTALACLGAGLTYLADDYCILAGGDMPVAHSLYSAAKARPADLDRLGFLLGLAEPPARPDEDKLLFFLARHFGPQLGSQSPITAIVVPRLRLGGRTTLSPATVASVAQALAVSTIAQSPHAGAEILRAVASLARQRPAFHLNLGDDAMQRAPALLRELAEGEMGAACA